jgi:magnesium chelatase family protein
MNPCPCGGGPPGCCECGQAQLQRYARRVSGPLLDRIDLRVPVERPAVDELLGDGGGEPSAVVARRVARARERALGRQGRLNGALAPVDLDRVAPLDPVARALLRHEMERDRLSGRGYHRLRRLARTIADLEVDPPDVVGEAHVALALRLRAGLVRTPNRSIAA